MDFVQSIKSGFANYANVQGRTPRSGYWYWALFTFLVGIAATILDVVIFHPGPKGLAPIHLITSLALLVPHICVSVRRLHDVDRSGWWLLIGFTIIGLFFPLLYWNCTKGTSGPNRFGPDPL